MARTYDEGLPGRIPVAISRYLEYLTHNQRNIRILEVGGGTGSATKVILEALQSQDTRELPSGIASVATYDFTDISAAFSESAQRRFANWSDILRYKTFDIEKDPSLQDFEVGTYDLVIATHVSFRLPIVNWP